MQQVPTCDVVPGETEYLSVAHVREVRIKGYGEDLLDVRGQVGNVVLLQFKLPDGNLPTFMT